MSSQVVSDILTLGRMPKQRSEDPEEVALYKRYQSQKHKLSDSDRLQLAPFVGASRKRGKPVTTNQEQEQSKKRPSEVLWECMAAFPVVFVISERWAAPHAPLLQKWIPLIRI